MTEALFLVCVALFPPLAEAEESWQADSGGMAAWAPRWQDRTQDRFLEYRHVGVERKFCSASETPLDELCGGLGMLVKVPRTGEPRLYMRSGATVSHLWDFVWSVPADLGTVTIGEDVKLVDQETTWASNRLLLEGRSGELSITVSRLTPAVLISTSAPAVQLLGGDRQSAAIARNEMGIARIRNGACLDPPRNWAVGTEEGVKNGRAGGSHGTVSVPRSLSRVSQRRTPRGSSLAIAKGPSTPSTGIAGH